MHRHKFGGIIIYSYFAAVYEDYILLDDAFPLISFI